MNNLVRIISIFLTLFLIGVLVFTLCYFAPGDYSSHFGEELNDESISLINSKTGKKGSYFSSLLIFLKNFFTFNWGEDIRGVSYKILIKERLKITLLLTIFSSILAISIALVWVYFSLLKPKGKADKALEITSLFLLTLPSFLNALILVLVFSMLLKWFPPSGVNDKNIFSILYSLFLPSLSLALLSLPVLMRMFKREGEEYINKNYSKLYIAFGASKKEVIFNEVLKPSLPFFLSEMANTIATSLSGTVVIERVFAISGIGSLLTEASLSRNLYLASYTVMLIAFIVSLIFLLSEIFSLILDPRLRSRK